MTQGNCCLPRDLRDLTHLSWLNGIKRLEKQETLENSAAHRSHSRLSAAALQAPHTPVDTRASDILASAAEPAGVLTPEEGPKAQLALRAERERDWKVAGCVGSQEPHNSAEPHPLPLQALGLQQHLCPASL